MKSFKLFTILLLLFSGLSCQSPRQSHDKSLQKREPQSLVDDLKEFYLKKIFIRKKHYRIFRDISKSLLKECPTNDCVLVGVGRSPTPLIAFIDNLIPQKMVQLPLSNFRFNTQGEKEFIPEILDRITQADTEYRYHLPKDLEEKLFRHFQNFMNHYQLEGKKIVLTDISNQSILAVYKYFQKYLEVSGSLSQVEVVQIIDSSFEPRMAEVESLYQMSAKRILINDYNLSFIFQVEGYDQYSPHGHHDIVKYGDDFNFSRKPFRSYAKLKKAMKFRMDNDRTLYNELNFLEFPNRTCIDQIKSLL